MAKIKVLSFNTLDEQFIDYSDLSADYSGISESDLKEHVRVPKIFKYLKESNADVFLLQEINLKVYKGLRDKFTNYKAYPLARHQTKKPYQKEKVWGNLIMVKKGILKKEEYYVYVTKSTGSAFAVLVGEINDKPFVFVNVHLDWIDKEDYRRKELAELNKLLAKYPNHKTIVSGDFNTNDPKTHKLLDMQAAVKEHMGTYLDDDPMIDWIYVKNTDVKHAKVDRPSKAKPHTPLKLYGSDHYPVVSIVGAKERGVRDAKYTPSTPSMSSRLGINDEGYNDLLGSHSGLTIDQSVGQLNRRLDTIDVIQQLEDTYGVSSRSTTSVRSTKNKKRSKSKTKK